MASGAGRKRRTERDSRELVQDQTASGCLWRLGASCQRALDNGSSALLVKAFMDA